jgi:chorismate lyase
VPAPLPADSDRDPRWRPEPQFTTAELSAPCRQWLLDDSSLTGRLVALHAGTFSVRRLYQGWEVPLPSEQRLLQVPARQRALVREVVLQLDAQPVVFARSVFPISSLSGELSHLRRLQNRSLGAILFRFPGMQRSPFELAQLSGSSAYLAPWVSQEAPAWARRSCFNISGKRLLVSEVFLQGFTPWDSSLPVHRSQRGTVSAAILGIKQ